MPILVFLMSYSCFEVELHPRGRVLKKLEKMGYNYNDLKNNKIIYYTNKVFNDEEREQIISLYKSRKYSLLEKNLKIAPYSTQFKKLKYVSSERLIGKTKAEAYLKRELALNKERKNTIFIKSLIKKIYTVYAIELNKGILESKKFLENNPNYKPNMMCLYIGQTSKSAKERFFVHMNNHRLGSKWVREYSISNVHDDADQSIFIYNLLKIKITNLTYSQSLQTEQLVAQNLRNKGYGVWFG